MGNVIESFASGVAKPIGNLFNAPLGFLSGKSCSSVCSPTWDFICYIEHFCVANLLKLGLVILVLYIVLFFFYLTYKLRIFHCICHTLCKTTWTCFAMCFYIWGHICHFMCHKLLTTRRRRRRRRRRHNSPIKDLEDLGYSSEDNDRDDAKREEGLHSIYEASPSPRWREHRRSHLRRSLKPRSHRVQVKVDHPYSRRHPSKHRNRDHITSNVHDTSSIKVNHTSKFAQKGKNCNRVSVPRSGRSGYLMSGIV